VKYLIEIMDELTKLKFDLRTFDSNNIFYSGNMLNYNFFH
jgi:hypothetical protein